MSNIDEQYEEIRGKGRGDRYERRDSERPWIPASVQNALLIAAIVGCAGSWWTFGQSIAVLKSVQEFQQRQIDKIEQRQNSLEGRITRGGPDALDQQ